jgi:hypothetical protein
MYSHEDIEIETVEDRVGKQGGEVDRRLRPTAVWIIVEKTVGGIVDDMLQGCRGVRPDVEMCSSQFLVAMPDPREGGRRQTEPIQRWIEPGERIDLASWVIVETEPAGAGSRSHESAARSESDTAEAFAENNAIVAATGVYLPF